LPSPTESPVNRQRKQILVVDDNRDAANTLAMLLEPIR
jgi:CheY-like chemotaxis protein